MVENCIENQLIIQNIKENFFTFEDFKEKQVKKVIESFEKKGLIISYDFVMKLFFDSNGSDKEKRNNLNDETLEKGGCDMNVLYTTPYKIGFCCSINKEEFLNKTE